MSAVALHRWPPACAADRRILGVTLGVTRISVDRDDLAALLQAVEAVAPPLRHLHSFLPVGAPVGSLAAVDAHITDIVGSGCAALYVGDFSESDERRAH